MTAEIWASAATFRRSAAEKVSFVLLNQVDLVLTLLALSLGFAELNPLMVYMFTVPVLLVVIKVALPLLIAWLIPGRLLVPSIILLCLVVSWNMKELLVYLF